MNAQFGGTIAENLSAHASFTLSLLERLCNAINESGSNGAIQNTEQVQNIIKIEGNLSNYFNLYNLNYLYYYYYLNRTINKDKTDKKSR